MYETANPEHTDRGHKFIYIIKRKQIFSIDQLSGNEHWKSSGYK